MLRLSLFTVLTATALMACGDDKNETTDGSTGSATGSASDTPGTSGATETSGATDEPGTATDTPTTTPTEGGTTMMGGDTAADGEACSANDDCASQGCLKWRDLEMGECVAAPPGDNTRIAGTLVDFVTGEPIASGNMSVLAALTAALSADPAAESPLLSAMSGADGHIDVTSASPIDAGVGIVGLVTGGDYYTTATGIAAPENGVYGPMNGNRDIWGMPSAKLTEWTGYLMTDPDVMPSLPLGDAGGVVGFVRDGSGAPKVGAKVVSMNDSTTAKIRYLADDGMSFNSEMTGTSGIFVLVAPGLAEKFTVEGGTSVGTAGSAKKAVFVLILTEP